MRTEVKSYALPLIEQFFGPSEKSVLLAIRRFAGECSSNRWPMADNIEHTDRPSSFTKSVSPPMPKEDWKSTFWVVEGDWMPPLERPSESNLCHRCRRLIKKSHAVLSLYRWLDIEKDNGHDCPKDGIRFTYKPLRFAKCRAQTRTITYTSKTNPERQTKSPKVSVECLAICRTWEEFETGGYWEKERERRAIFERWVEEERGKKEKLAHPADKPIRKQQDKPNLSPSAAR